MKKCIILLAGSILLLLPQKDSSGCGYTPMPEEYRFYILHPGSSGRDELSTFYFTTEYFNTDLQINSAAEEANLNEWGQYFRYKYSKECLKKIIYQSDIGCVYNKDCYDTLLASCPGLINELNWNTKPGRYFMYMHECLGYLHFMEDPWEETSTTDTSALARVINKGNKLLAEFVNEPFLEKRVAYNLIRLYYYAGNVANLGKIYNRYFSPTKQESMIDGSAYFYYIQTAHNKNEFDYILSRVFDFSLEKKKRSLELFTRQNIDATLKYAKNNHEQAVIHSMWLLQHPGKGLETLEKIYKLEPGYKDFDILLSREINKLEDWILTPRVAMVEAASHVPMNGNNEKENYNHYYMQLKNRENDLSYVDKVIKFSKKLFGQKGYAKKELVHLYLTHLYMMKNELDDATKQYALALKGASADKNTIFDLQLKVDGIVLHFMQSKGMDAKGQQLLLDFNKVTKQRSSVYKLSIQKNLLQFVGMILHEKGHTGWASLCINKAFDLDYDKYEWEFWGAFIMGDYHNAEHFLAQNGKESDFELVLNLIDKKSPTPFEEFILKDEYVSWNETIYYYPSNFDRDKLQDYRARIKIRQDSLETALSYLKTVSDKHWLQYPHDEYASRNPFLFNHGLGYYEQVEGYNLKELVTEMISIKAKINTNYPQKDSLYLLLANAYYNITVHGNYWIAQNFWRETDYFPPAKLKLYNPQWEKEYYGCTKALYWYEKVIESTQDKSRAVVAVMMADKCRTNYVQFTGSSTKKYYTNYLNQYKKMLTQRLGIDNDKYDEITHSCDTWDDYFYNQRSNFKKKG